MIRVQNITKNFGAVKAVRDVSFEAPDGKITGLLGPNGAGKSTTLRVLYTVIKPAASMAWTSLTTRWKRGGALAPCPTAPACTST